MAADGVCATGALVPYAIASPDRDLHLCYIHEITPVCGVISWFEWCAGQEHAVVDGQVLTDAETSDVLLASRRAATYEEVHPGWHMHMPLPRCGAQGLPEPTRLGRSIAHLRQALVWQTSLRARGLDGGRASSAAP